MNCLTLVDHDEVEYSTVVSVLLFGVAGEANVFSLILEGDVPQQYRDVTLLTGAHEHQTFMVDHHMRLQALGWDHPLTKLKGSESLVICGDELHNLQFVGLATENTYTEYFLFCI